MTKKEMQKFLENLEDNEEIEIYVFDAEYGEDNLFDIGYGTIVEIEKKCLTMHINVSG